MGNTEWTPAVWQDEEALIRIAAAKYGLDWHLVAAIRKAENGGAGKEFGVLSVKAPTYVHSLTCAARRCGIGWCNTTRTIRHWSCTKRRTERKP